MKVAIFEQASTYAPYGGPIQIQSNALRALQRINPTIYEELVKAGTVPLRPGVLRVVDEAIAAGVPMAVCSTSQEASVRTLVQTLMGDERYAKFDFFCGDVVPRKKPNPDVYNLAAETMGYAADRCVVIEDSLVGLRAAYAAPGPLHPFVFWPG